MTPCPHCQKGTHPQGRGCPGSDEATLAVYRELWAILCRPEWCAFALLVAAVVIVKVIG